jgi:hypothetical protein
VTVGLPWLESLGGLASRAHASGESGFPLRFGLFYWGNGVIPSKWVPTEEGEDFTLSEQLSSLEAHQSKLTVLSGYAVNVPNTVPHWSGAAGLLSAQAMLEEGDGDTFAGPSIDQVIGQAIGGETLYRSIQSAATDVSGVSFNGPYSRNPPETDPYALYERLFGATFVEPGGEGIVDPRLGLRRSALDAVLGDLNRLSSQVSSADQIRLEQHAEGIREIERRLARLQEDPPNLEACFKPDAFIQDFTDVNGRPQIALRNEAMCSLLAMALACDQTRVFGHYISDPVDNVLFPGASTGHHELTHNEPGEQPEVNAISQHCVGQFAVLLDKLDAIEEGDGTLLDHCGIMACSEVSLGQTHSLDNMPILLAGGADGHFKTGLHHRSYSLESTTKVLISLQRAMGMNVTSFGTDDAYSEDEVTEILA